MNFLAQNIWLLVPVQGKSRSSSATLASILPQQGSSLNAGGINYGMQIPTFEHRAVPSHSITVNERNASRVRKLRGSIECSRSQTSALARSAPATCGCHHATGCGLVTAIQRNPCRMSNQKSHKPTGYRSGECKGALAANLADLHRVLGHESDPGTSCGDD
jgi:hypothetical protein